MNDDRERIEAALSHRDPDEASWPPIAQRIRAARERVGLTQCEVALRLGLSRSTEYQDMEFHDSEACTCFSISHLAKLACVIQLPLSSMLFGSTLPPVSTRVSFQELSTRLNGLLQAEGGRIEEVSNRIGWDLEPLVSDGNELGDLNVDGLRDVCRAVDVDWVAVLLWAEDRIASS